MYGKHTLFFLILLFVAIAAYGKTQQTMLRAFVYDPENNPVDSLEISLTNAADTVAVPFKKLESSGSRGFGRMNELRLLFDGEVGNSYSLMFESEGFKPVVKIFTLTRKEKIKDFGFIRLERDEAEELAGVTVTATRVKMVMNGDTVIYNADAFKLAEGSMLEELVRQLPGVKLDADGVITYNGRKLNELLLNGKNFFQGDPKVALENLPAYTVKNLKIYDKKSKYAHLSGDDQRLDYDNSRENLVLDVNLKKEYIKGGIGNLEGGYGIGDRYIGRVFGMAYTDVLRLSAYGKANNIGDSSRGSFDSDWSGGWSSPGESDIQAGGIDYNYSNKDESVTAGGNLNVVHTDGNTDNIASSVSFYPSSDLYRRNTSHSRNKSLSLDFRNDLEIKRDWFWFRLDPSVNYRHGDNYNRSRQATFNAPLPEESYRGEALDSVFAGSRLYSKDMLTRLLTLGVGRSEDFGADVRFSSMMSPDSWRGHMSFSLNGNYRRSNSDSRNIYDQGIGPAGNPETVAQNSDRFSTNRSTNKSFAPTVSYVQRNSYFTEKYTHNIGFNTDLSYNYTKSSGNTDMFTSDELPPLDRLPSVETPEHAIADLENSNYSSTMNNSLASSVSLSYNISPISTKEDSYNTRFDFALNLGFRHSYNRLDYDKPEEEPQIVRQTLNTLTPSINVSLSTSKGKRRNSLYMNYSRSESGPSLNFLLNTRTSANPFEIYIGADELKNSVSHSMSLNFSSLDTGHNFSNLMANAMFSLTENSVANTRVYNENTGVTVNRPINVNGNWVANMSTTYMFSFGKDRKFQLSSSLSSMARHSVDYLSLGGEPERSSVMNYSVSPNVDFSASFGNSYLSAGMGVGVFRQTSDRENFDNRTSFTYSPSVRGMLSLPANFSIDTSLSAKFVRGYSDPNMNVSEWLWNITASKTLLKGKLVLKATAVDLLHSVKNVSINVNAQGRSETWSRTIPRYVLFGLTYNFSIMPGKKKSGAPGMMPGRAIHYHGGMPMRGGFIRH